LDCVANPLGLVATLLEAFPTERTTVHLMDMQGIANVEMDVGHVIACDVLEVPCTTQHWLPNLDNIPISLNTRVGDSGLTSSQLEDMGWLLRQRDCSYRRQLQRHVFTGRDNNSNKDDSSSSSMLILHYADTIWDGCDDDDEEEGEEHDEFSSFLSGDHHVRNTTWLMEHLQSQVGCGPLSRTALEDLRRQHQESKPKPSPPSSSMRLSEIHPRTIQTSRVTPSSVSQHSIDRYGVLYEDLSLHQTAIMNLLAVNLLVVAIMGSFLGRVKCNCFLVRPRRYHAVPTTSRDGRRS